MTSHGQRNTLITLQRDIGTGKDDHGGKIENWQLYASEWVSVYFGAAQERREASQETATQTATFRALANSKTRSLTPRDRIAGYLGVNWDITGVAHVSASEVEITATSKAA